MIAYSTTAMSRLDNIGLTAGPPTLGTSLITALWRLMGHPPECLACPVRPWPLMACVDDLIATLLFCTLLIVALRFSHRSSCHATCKQRDADHERDDGTLLHMARSISVVDPAAAEVVEETSATMPRRGA